MESIKIQTETAAQTQSHQISAFEQSAEMGEYLKILQQLVGNDFESGETGDETESLQTVLDTIQYIQYLNQLIGNN